MELNTLAAKLRARVARGDTLDLTQPLLEGVLVPALRNLPPPLPLRRAEVVRSATGRTPTVTLAGGLDCRWSIPGLPAHPLVLSRVSLAFSQPQPELEPRADLTLEGQLTLADSAPLDVRVRELDGQRWQAELATDAPPRLGLSTLRALAGDTLGEGLPPAGLLPFKGGTPTRLVLTFDLEGRGPTTLDVTVATGATWRPLRGLALGGVEVVLGLCFGERWTRRPGLVTASVRGEGELGGVPVRLELSRRGKDEWALETPTAQRLGLAALAALAGVQGQLPGFEQALREAGFEGLTLEFARLVLDANERALVTLDAAGMARWGERRVDLAVGLLPRPSLRGELPSGRSLDVRALVGRYHPGAGALPPLSATSARFLLGAAEGLAVCAELSGEWLVPLGARRLALREAALELEQVPAEGGPRTTVVLRGEAEFAGAKLAVRASLGESLTVEGSLTRVRLGALLRELPRFEALPAGLADLELWDVPLAALERLQGQERASAPDTVLEPVRRTLGEVFQRHMATVLEGLRQASLPEELAPHIQRLEQRLRGAEGDFQEKVEREHLRPLRAGLAALHTLEALGDALPAEQLGPLRAELDGRVRQLADVVEGQAREFVRGVLEGPAGTSGRFQPVDVRQAPASPERRYRLVGCYGRPLTLDEGGQVRQEDWRGSPRQLWRLVPLRGEHAGWSLLVCEATPRGVDLHRLGSAPLPSEGWHTQQWRLEALEDGSVHLRCRYSDETLDAYAPHDGPGPVASQGWHGGPSQRWRLEELLPPASGT